VPGFSGGVLLDLSLSNDSGLQSKICSQRRKPLTPVAVEGIDFLIISSGVVS